MVEALRGSSRIAMAGGVMLPGIAPCYSEVSQSPMDSLWALSVLLIDGVELLEPDIAGGLGRGCWHSSSVPG